MFLRLGCGFPPLHVVVDPSRAMHKGLTSVVDYAAALPT